MPQPRMSLFEMIEEYRASLPQGRGTAQQAPLPMPPAVNYGDPMTHPGEPMGQDQIPAWLTEGEFVVNAEAMSDPMNAQVVNDINTEGQMMQDQGLGLGMNRGGYVEYMQDGGLAGAIPGIGQGLHDFASSEAGATAGQRLALIGAGDLAGAASVPTASARARASAGDTDYSTQTWIDPQTGNKYVRQERNGQVRFVDLLTNQPVTDEAVLSRIRQAGTSGTGEATEGEPPKNLLAKNDGALMDRALTDAKAAIHAGAGDIIDFINRKSVSGAELAKVIGAAKAAGGNEEVFRVLNSILGDAMIRLQEEGLVDQYYNFLHNVSQFEVIASKTSGESRLTDEDAKRYLRAIVDPTATPNSILEQLGRSWYALKYERARTEAWGFYINEQARADQKNEYWFNKNVWNEESKSIEAQRNEIIGQYTDPKWSRSGNIVEGSKDELQEGQYRVEFGGKAYIFEIVDKDVVPDDVKKTLKDAKGVDVPPHSNVAVARDDATGNIYALANVKGDKSWRRKWLIEVGEG